MASTDRITAGPVEIVTTVYSDDEAAAVVPEGLDWQPCSVHEHCRSALGPDDTAWHHADEGHEFVSE